MNQIIIERFHLPDTGPIHIQVDFIGEIKFNADAARRKANTYLLTNVTNLSYAGRQPGLVLGERLVWRFPAMLALPSYGEIGRLAYLMSIRPRARSYPSPPPLFLKCGNAPMSWLVVFDISQRQESDCLAACGATRLDDHSSTLLRLL